MKMVRWRKSFEKDYNKLAERHQRAFIKALKLFNEDARCKKLRRHKLSGEYIGLESIDVAPDLRALFLEAEDKFIFYYLKNHNQLYS